MSAIIKHQNVVKRKKRLFLPLKTSVSRSKKEKPRVMKNRSFPLMKHVNAVLKTARRVYRGNSVYFIAGTFLAPFIIFLSLSVPISGLTTRHRDILIPKDDEIEEMLISYLNPQDNGGGEIRIPAESILTSVSPEKYVVRKGDTPSGIAEKYGLRLDTLLSFNNIQDVRKLKIGVELQVPDLDGVIYSVRKGDSLSVIAYRYGIQLNDLLDVNNLASSVIRVGQELFIPGGRMSSFDLKKATGELFVYPARGRLASGYGLRKDPFTGVNRMHYGIDLANAEGVPVVASMDGTVVAIGSNEKGYGKYIILKHQAGFQTLYAHLLKWSVTKGQKVIQGQKIGEMGNTGRSTGPHLHFAIYHYQKPVDPLHYLF